MAQLVVTVTVILRCTFAFYGRRFEPTKRRYFFFIFPM